MAIVTPSAKSHERVSGRWHRDLKVQTPRDWLVYYVKILAGTPIPWLLLAYAFVAFVSRAGVEIAAWGAGLLTVVYIIADRLGSTREFEFFPLGCDFFLAGYAFVGLLSALDADSIWAGLTSVGGIRWVLLFYLTAYSLELFPGLNRLYGFMIAGATIACLYGIWQHFTGLDLLNGSELARSPLQETVFFTPRSFFSSTEIMATLLAMALPFPIAAYLLADRREALWRRLAPLGLGLLFAFGVFWSYRPGLWIAGFGGFIIAVLMKPRHTLSLLLPFVSAGLVGIFLSYGSLENLMTPITQAEEVRAERQRAQINTQVALWQSSPWVGVGERAKAAANYDPETGNVYFHILAQNGVLGVGFYFLFLLGFLLATYRAYHEIPESHYWHRTITAGGLGSQMAFHLSGLYWSTMNEALAFNFFILVLASISYLSEHYSRGIVTDDHSL